ncbi:GDSL-type esterase/lipase family protein [Fulvivirgaceae bacterium BMA12]|uniref:GDSL-type esterase/lipase family protein n=1 Tax=Agaribacillus aureus TaxID=3051825 RepID=A0ABT8L144_9BACT|nr:GDSL-type esterase/lipase family protein [Fulvivirgaceae bacterium BMA12]
MKLDLRIKAKIILIVLLIALPSLTYSQLRIMPLGNSITQGVAPSSLPSGSDNGYRKRLYQQLVTTYPGLQFVGSESNGDGGFDQDHEGHPSWRADEIRDNIYINGENWLTNNPADVILLHIGTNDISGQSLPGIVTEIEEILDKVDQYETANNTEVIVFVAKIVRFLFGAFDGSETTDLNNQIETMVNQRIANGDKLVLVDQESAIIYPGGLPDDIHPDQTGYNSMADVWEQAITATLAAPQITDPGTMTATIGSNFQYQIVATGVPTPTVNVSNLPTGMTYNPGTQTVSWTPNESQEGPASFDVTATNAAGTDNLTININVIQQNNPPVFTKGPDVVISEDAGPQEFLNWATGVDDGDSELTQNVSFNIVDVSSSNSYTISPTISPAGHLTFTPGDNVNGTFTVTISLSDDGSPVETSGQQTFTVTINAVNDSPDFTISGNTITVDEDFTNTEEITVTPGTVPVDEQSESVSYSVSPSSSDVVDVSVDNATGKISITSLENKNGVENFTLTADDGGSQNNTFSMPFTVTVNAINDPPVFNLSEANLELTVGFDPTEVNALAEEVPLDEASQTVSYSIAPSTVDFVDISVDNTGKISISPKAGNKTGQQEFAVLANDGQSVNNTYVASFVLAVTLTVGIEDELEKSIKMYPIPAENELNVQLENEYLGPVDLKLYDLNGGLITSDAFFKATTLINKRIKVDQIKSGLYLMKIQLDRGEVWSKVLIK